MRSFATRALSLEALVEAVEYLVAVDQLSALCLEPAAFDLLTPLQANLVVFLQQPKTLPDDLAGVVVQPALDLSVHEFLEFWCQRHVHGDLAFLLDQGSRNNRL